MIRGAADSHKPVSHFADKCVAGGAAVQRHGTVTVMYCLCIGVCVHLSQTTALQEGTAAQRRACQALVDLGKSARARYKLARYISEITQNGCTLPSSQRDPSREENVHIFDS